MFEFFKKLSSKINKLDSFISDYKENAGEVSMPGYAYMNWGMKLLDGGDEKGAIEMLKMSTRMPYANSNSYVNLGVALAREEKYREALLYFRKAVKLDIENARAYQMMGSVYSETGKFKRAERAFEISINYAPRNPQTYVTRAIFYAKINKLKEADDDFRTSCRLNPSSPQAWFLWGVLCAQMKKYEDAKERFQKTLTIDPFHGEAYFHMASISFLEKDYKNAIKYAKKSIGINPKKTEIYIVLAESWLNLKDEEKCFAAYHSGEEKCGANSAFYYSFGVSLQYFKRWEDSVSKLKKAIELDDKNHSACFGLAVAYLKTGERDLAVEMFKKTISICPNHTASLYNLGRQYSKSGNHEDAVKYFERAIAGNSRAGHIYINIAKEYEAVGNLGCALDMWKKAVEYNPNSIEAKIGLTNAHVKAGDGKSALRTIRALYKENKENKQILLMYGCLLSDNGSHFEALEKFEELLKINPDFDVAKYAKIECLIRAERLEDAENELSSLNDETPEQLYLKALLLEANIKKYNKTELIEQAIDICDKIFAKKENARYDIKRVENLKNNLIKMKEQ